MTISHNCDLIAHNYDFIYHNFDHSLSKYDYFSLSDFVFHDCDYTLSKKMLFVNKLLYISQLLLHVILNLTIVTTFDQNMTVFTK